MRTIIVLNFAAVDASAHAHGIIGREALLALLGVPAFDPVTPHLLAALHRLLGLDVRELAALVRCETDIGQLAA